MNPTIENQSKTSALIKLVTDLDLRIIEFNEQVLHTAGHIHTDIHGCLIQSVLPFFTAEKLAAVQSRCLQQPNHTENIETKLGVNGHARHFTWMVCALTNHHGHPKAFQWVGAETTARKTRLTGDRFDEIVLDNISDALITLDQQIKVTAFNKKAEEIYGIRACEIEGRRMNDFFVITPVDDTAGDPFVTVHQNGAWKGVLQVRKRSGELLYTSCHIVAVRSDAGALLGYVSIDREITDQYCLNQRHKEQATIKTLLYEIMDQTGALAWAADAQGRICYMNATFRQAFGITGNGQVHLSEVLQQTHLEWMMRNNKQVIGKGTMLDAVGTLGAAGEGDVKYRILQFPVRAGECIFAAGFAFDITKEIQREEELNHLKLRFQKAANIIADVISDWDIVNDRFWRSDPENEICVHPTAARSMAERYSRLHPSDLERFRSSLQQAIDSGAEKWQCEYRYASGIVPGCYKILNERAVFLRDAAGKAVRMISAVQDVTEQRRLQKELGEKEQAIIAANIEGQEAERSELARELHDNVGQVLAMCKLFVDIAADDIHHEHLEKCRQQLQLAIAEIRNLSHRLSPEKLTTKGLPAALEDMVGDINDTGRLNIDYHKCTDCNTALLPRNIQITAYRVVQECIANILKHAAATNTFLRMHIDGQTLLIEIKDDGKGFDPAQVKQGIGLKNITNRLELHGGKLDLKSAPGQGCSIVIYLPVSS